MRKIIIICIFILLGNFSNAAEVYKLNNGQTLIIEENHSNPIVTIDTWIKTGSINENDKNNGVSHFLEHLFFKGTEKHPYGDFDRILESKGAINNAATSKDFTHYYITIPSKYFELALDMHADMLLNPAIPEQEMEKERKVVIEEISKDLNNPSTIAYDNLIQMMYINHPYKRKVIGTKEIIENIKREEILDYFNTFYSPSNMVTIISGNVEKDNVLNLVKEKFKCNNRKTPKISYSKEKQLPSLLRKVVTTQTESGYMLIGFRGVKIIDKDSYALDVLSTILGDGKSSVFYKTIKDEKQLAFSISASNSTFKDDGIFYISANFVPDNYEKLESTIFEEIERIKKNGVTDEQVKIAQNIIERETFYSLESVSNIAQEIGYTMVTAGDINFYNDYIKNIKKVTPKDIKIAANKYLGLNKAAISVVLPENNKEVKISSKTSLPTDYKLENENNETQKYKLSNGATILYTPNTSNEIIAISIIAKGGEFIEEKAGTGKLTASLMLKSTKNYSSEELSKELENNGIKITPNSKADMFSISVLTTKNEIDKTLNLLDEIVNNAKFDNSDIEKIKKEKINAIKKNRDLPLQRAVEEYNTLVYQGSLYSNSTKILEKTYPQINRDDIVKYYSKIFEPQNIILSINGNTDITALIKRLSKIFNKPQNNIFEYNKYSIPYASSPRISKQTDSKTQTDWIFLGWQTDGLMNTKDFATLSVIDSLLGSGMSSRLFINLREREGLAYQLGSSFNPSMLKGNFVVYIGTNPQTFDKSLEMLFVEINKLKSEPVSNAELQGAKDKLLGQYVLAQETNLEKAYAIGWYEASGRGYNFKKHYEELINSVSAEDIINTANKYFNKNYILSVVKN